MNCFGLFDQSLICQLIAGIFLIFIWAVPDRVKSAQCPNCTGEIKRVNTSTGKCHSCFPCPQCIVDYTTSSVPCETTVPFGTDISCVLIQLDPKASSQARSLTSSPVTVTTSSKFYATPVTSIARPLVISATSSLVSAGHSIAQGEGGSWSTKEPKTEKVLPSSNNYSKWMKHTAVYIISTIFLLIISGAIAYRCKKVRDRDKVQRQPRVIANRPACVLSVQPPTAQDNETVGINFTTSNVGFSRTHSCDQTYETGDQFPSVTAAHSNGGNTNLPTSRCEVDNSNHDLTKLPGTPSQPDETTRDSHSQTDHNTSFVNCILVQGNMIVQPGSAYNQPLPPVLWPQSLVDIVKNGPITHGLDQQVRAAVNWSALSQDEKYNTKILEMPFQLLYNTCLSLDLPRTDGKDNRLLAYKLGLTVREFELLKQAASTQNPGDPITYVVLKERFYSTKPAGTVGDFVNIMKEIGREDIVSDINDWSELN